jgi:hypothetical protein
MRTIVSLETQIVIRLLLCFVSLTAFAATVCAQERIASPNENIDWPSPDGRFAFLTSYGEDRRTIELIDKKSGKNCGSARKIRAKLTGIRSGRPIRIGSL